MIFVTHDTREAIELAQRVVVLSKGPATVVADMEVDLSDEERDDPILIERWRDRLVLSTRQGDAASREDAGTGGDEARAEPKKPAGADLRSLK